MQNKETLKGPTDFYHTILPRDHISKKRSNLKNVSTQESTQSENYFQKYDELIIAL